MNEPQIEPSIVSSTHKLNILQCLPSLNSGGVERGTVDICRYLLAQGHTVHVASAGGRWVEELTDMGVRHWTLPLHRKNPLQLLRNARHLRQIIRQQGIQVVHGRSRAPAWSAYAATRGLKGVAWVTTFHGCYSLGPWGLKKIYNRSMVTGDTVIAVSHFMADHIRAHYAIDPGKIHVIHRGVDTAVFDPAALSDARRRAAVELCGWRQDRLRLLVPARLTPWKGQLEFLRHWLALPPSLQKRGDVVICGDVNHSDYATAIRALIKTHGAEQSVRLVGHGQDMPAIYDSADLVVALPTRAEAFGRIAIEAGAMERLIIASRLGGLCESIVDQKTGWLVDPLSQDEFREAFAACLALDESARSELQAQARARVVDHFSMTRMCADTQAIYQHLVANRNRRFKDGEINHR